MERQLEAVAVVRGVAEAWNRHDLNAVYGALTEDYHEYVNGVLVKTSAAEARAIDQAALYDLVPDYRRSVEELWGVGDRVVSRFTIFGNAVDGRRLELREACVYGVRADRVFEAHLFFDPAAAWHAPG